MSRAHVVTAAPPQAQALAPASLMAQRSRFSTTTNEGHASERRGSWSAPGSAGLLARAPRRPFARPSDSWHLEPAPAAGEPVPVSLRLMPNLARVPIVQPTSARPASVRAHAPARGHARPAVRSLTGPGGVLQRAPNSGRGSTEQSQAVNRDWLWWVVAIGFGLLGARDGAEQSVKDLVVGVYESVVDIVRAIPGAAKAAGNTVLDVIKILKRIPEYVRAIPDLVALAPSIRESVDELATLLRALPGALMGAITLKNMKHIAKTAWNTLTATVDESTKPLRDSRPDVAGRFVGEIIGYAVVEVLLAIFSGGGATALKVATKARKLVQVAKGAKFLGLMRKVVHIVKQVLTKARSIVQKVVKLLDDLWAKLRAVLSKKRTNAPGKPTPGKGKDGKDKDGEDAPTGTAASPIPITFYKVDTMYDTLELEGFLGKQTFHPFEKKQLPTPRMRRTAADIGTEEAELGKGIVIGLSNWNRPSVLRVLGGPLKRVERPDDSTRLTGTFRTALKARGAKLESKQIDHVHDLALSGDDAVRNMWPLDAAVNRAANQTYSQKVSYRVGKQVRQASVKSLTGKYFKITKIKKP
jgi:hypothetical protein